MFGKTRLRVIYCNVQGRVAGKRGKEEAWALVEVLQHVEDEGGRVERLLEPPLARGVEYIYMYGLAQVIFLP